MKKESRQEKRAGKLIPPRPPRDVCDIRGGELIRYHGSSEEFVIPDQITTIAAGAFRDCRTLTSVVVGKGVTAIRRDAFRDCVNLKQIILPAGLLD